jgi:hypothetical protein
MTEESKNKIEETYARILTLCQNAFEKDLHFELVMYGSAINGLSLGEKNGSDLDLIVVIKSILCEDLSDQIIKEMYILESINELVRINSKVFTEA